MKKILIASLMFLLVSTFSASATSFPLWGGDLHINMLIDAMRMSLKDSGDSIYLGTLKGDWHVGIGAETSLFYPISPGIKAGPHFIFAYNTIDSSWHSFKIFQMSLGGILDFDIGNNTSISTFLDYNLGWFSAEQEISSASGTLAPAGAFAGGMPGLILGIKTCTKVSETMGVGVYFNIGSLALTGIKYKRLISGSYSNRWMNAEITFSQAGVTIYF